MHEKPLLNLIIPCYNEETVLPLTVPLFLTKIQNLIGKEIISEQSKILFVDDGSKDQTWKIIKNLSKENKEIEGIRQSRNRGHQNALLVGLMESKDSCDITITMDCDGQDDINAIDEMVEAYKNGNEIVYGVRKDRKSDTWFKRNSAQFFYRLMGAMGADVVYDHADFRLVSSKVLEAFADFHEVNIFLRGMFPLIGFSSTCVFYERKERMAGKTKYPLKKMLLFALDGITSLSVKPIYLILWFGMISSFIGFIGILYALVAVLMGNAVHGWASTICIVCFLGGIQTLSIGVIGEYIGKIYLETKHRPRYIISERTEGKK